MAFVKAIQSSPELRGVIGAPSAWSGGGTVTPTMHGIYRGKSTATLTFTVDTAGTLNTTSSIEVSWSDGTRSGVLQLGTNAGIAEDDIVQVVDGVSISFASNGNTFVASATFTVTLTAWRRLRPDHQSIEADGTPLDIQVTGTGISSIDDKARTSDGRQARTAIANLREATTTLDVVEKADSNSLLKAIHNRHLFCLFENYGSETVGLWRASRGPLPMLGPEISFTRSGTGTYLDPDSGLITTAASGIGRFPAGPIGRSIVVSQGSSTNLFSFSHPTTAAEAWTTKTGTPTITKDPEILPPIDPADSNIDASQRANSQKVEMASGEEIQHLLGAVTVSTSTTYTASVWVRGRGRVTFDLNTDTVTPPGNTKDTETVTLNGEDWQRIVLTGATGSDTRADVIVTAEEDSVIWLACKQIEAGHAATSWIPTTTTTAARNGETVTWSPGIPASGTLSFGVYLDQGTHSGDLYLLETDSDGRFGVRYDATNTELEFHTDSSGALTSSQTLTPGTWYNIVVTWDRSSTAGELDRAIYVNGSSLTSDSTTSWATDWGDTLQYGKSGGTAVKDIRFCETRLDSYVWSSDEITRQYERFTNGEWLRVMRELGGRFFDVDTESTRDLSTSHPEQQITVINWIEADSADDELVMAR